MQTTQCPICSSDIIIDEESSEKDLVNCLNCGAELEIVTLQPLQLNPLQQESGEEDDNN
ncbi:lysine biosynthesis protein LysW [Patescibacteria group bacterium]|nr:lysine biosynthesis protein LysW [Patescibacteria group bacterium]MBU1663388.1 lysine biosynthesis protein LysW [Patescibacteria group bacterium]MBU1933745.1 lysine biosynthesis protein LysW [Patescibacteria group bacterium]MBU2008048.1 lysine biosynthesis protein LysW [Patescibacteria group bacterium]MBU2233742.1 lysine biosynthesis protein LysW [Patescibacteria group bacterium]